MTQEIYDRVVRDGRRRRARFLGGAAVVVAGLVTAGVVLLPGDGSTDRLVAVDAGPPAASPSAASPSAASPSNCPATAEQAPDQGRPAPVPQLPEGFDGSSQLLPEGVPTSALVCRYEQATLLISPLQPNPGGRTSVRVGALVGGRTLTSGLSDLAHTLETPPFPDPLRQCGDPDFPGTPVRVRITYPSGARAWLATETNPRGCTGIGNGLFVNKIDVGAQLLEAWKSGQWDPAPSETVAPVVAADDCPTEATVLPSSSESDEGARFPVPSPPTGFDAAARLLPAAVPSGVLVCRYKRIEAGSGDVAPLLGGKVLGGDLADLADFLDVLQPSGFASCRLVGELGPPVQVRVLLRYPSGASAWLATETDVNGCTGIGNGLSSSNTYLTAELLDAWDKGRWDGLQPRYPCDVPYAGRPGQTEALVPGGSSQVSVCRQGTFVPVSDPVEVVRLLNEADRYSPPGSPFRDGRLASDGAFGCTYGGSTPQPLQTEPIQTVRIDYPRGRSVLVQVNDPACTPPWQNGSFGAGPTPEQQTQLLDLLAR